MESVPGVEQAGEETGLRLEEVSCYLLFSEQQELPKGMQQKKKKKKNHHKSRFINDVIHTTFIDRKYYFITFFKTQ